MRAIIVSIIFFCFLTWSTCFACGIGDQVKPTIIITPDASSPDQKDNEEIYWDDESVEV